MKNNKKIVIILIVLTIGLIFCASLIVYNHFFKSNRENVIDIDDCTNKGCDKKKDDNKKDDSKKDDKKDNDYSKDKDNKKNNDNQNNNNGTNNNPNSGSGNGQGTGTGDGSGNGTGSESSSSGNGQGSGSGRGSGSSSGTTPSDEPAKNVVVSDNNTTWSQDTNLKIFNVDSIAPGYNGSYEFAINNNSDGNVVYNISFSEENPYNVNLLYKLKMNGNYIAGDSDTWISSSDLSINNKVLDSEYMDSFYLEWRWVDSNHDTIAGTTPGAKYTLNVNVSSRETTEHDTSGSGSINPHTGDKIIIYIEICLGSAIAVLLLILLKRKKNESIEHN